MQVTKVEAADWKTHNKLCTTPQTYIASTGYGALSQATGKFPYAATSSFSFEATLPKPHIHDEKGNKMLN